MDKNDYEARETEFLRKLEQITRETGIKIGGCGCCGSPFTSELTTEERDPRAGYGFNSLADIDYIYWISPSDKYDWEHYSDSIVK